MAQVNAGTLYVGIAGDTSDLEKSLQDAEKDLKGFDSKVGSSVKSLFEMKKEFKALSRESLVGKSPQEIEAMQKRMAYLKDAIGDTNSTIKSLSLDPFQKLAETVQVGSTVMGGLAGATSLLGGDQERLNELMQKTVALIAISNAAQEASVFFQERSAGIWLKNKTLEISTRLKEILTINTTTAASTAENAVKGKGNLITQAITKAQWLWNAAVAANPIGLLIAGIAALGIGIGVLVSKLSSAKEAQTSLNTSIDGTTFKTKDEVNAHNDTIFKLQELQDEVLFTIGVYDEYDKKLNAIDRDRKKANIGVTQTEQESIDKANGFWQTLWLNIKNAGIQAGVYKDVLKKEAEIHDKYSKQKEENDKVYEAQKALLDNEEKQREKKKAEDIEFYNRSLFNKLLTGKAQEIANLELQRDKDLKQENINAESKKLIWQNYYKDLANINANYANQAKRKQEEEFLIQAVPKIISPETKDLYLKPLEAKIPEQKIEVPVKIDLKPEVSNLTDLIDISNAISESVTQGLNDLTSGIAESIGEIAAGTGDMDDLFRNMLSVIGDFLSSLGKSLIAAGIGAIAFDSLLENPAAAIAAGVALVALGSIVKNKLAEGPNGSGSSYSSANVNKGSSGDYTGTRGLRGDGTIKIQVTGKLTGSGRDLQAVLDEEAKRRAL